MMIGRRFVSSFLSKMNPNMMKQNLSTSSKTAYQSLSKMDPITKKTQKSQVLPSFSLLKVNIRNTMKEQNDADLVLASELIASKARNSNFVFSPASINTAYRMMTAGSGYSSEDSNAFYSKIANVVFADGSARGGPKISAINGVWVEQSRPLDHSLKDLIENNFKATYAEVDFRFKAEQVLRELNKWASDQTNGIITDLLPPGSVTDETIQVYGNALYFKGAWKNKFNKLSTKEDEFHLLNGSSVSVPFMSSNKNQYVEAYNGFKVLRLPFQQGSDKDREFSMFFYLPDKKNGLDNLMEKMASTPGFVDDHIPTNQVEVGAFRIPKFNISFMFDVFLASTGLIPKPRMYHKACVEIDEEGAVASAATFIIRRISFSVRRTKIDFVADHPFLFVIREDKTATILFAGQILDPSKKSSV